jgi:hypothetical protein
MVSAAFGLFRLEISARKAGNPFPIQHFHSPELSLSFTLDTSRVGLNVTREGLMFAMAERKANVWLARLP